MIRVVMAGLLATFPAAASPLFVADTALGQLTSTEAPWRLTAAEQVLPDLCGSGSGVALLARTPSPSEMTGCGPQVLSIRVGRQVAYLVSKAGSGLRSFSSAQLFDGVVAPGGAAPGTWHDVDPNLPPLPIRALLPPAGSGLDRLFAATLLEVGCLLDPNLRSVFDAAARQTACTKVRGDGAVERRTDGDDVASWLDRAPAGAIAVVTAAEIDRLPGGVVALAVDDIVPTYRAVTSDAYRGTLPVTMVLVPGYGPEGSEVMAAAEELTGEQSLGPGGRLVAGGLVPLPGPERVALRARLAALGAFR